MGTIRIPKERSFFSVSNALAQDKTLSFEAVGMLAYLLSKPDDWQMRTFDIEARGNIGKTARRSIMKETERAGYITFHTGRNKEGQLESWYQLHEQPVPEDQRTQSWETGKAKQPGAGFPPPADLTAGEPAAGQASAGQPAPLVNIEVQITDLQKTDKTAAEPFNFDPEPDIKNSTAFISAIDQIAAYLRQLYGIPETAGHTIKGQYQSLAMHLEGAGATLEQIKAFWEFRYKKPQVRYFCGDFTDWRVNENAKKGSNAKTNGSHIDHKAIVSRFKATRTLGVD